MTNEKLTELKALCDAATDGPWGTIANYGGWSVRGGSAVADEITGIQINPHFVANADFIVAARIAVPELIAEIEGHQHQLDGIGQYVKGLEDKILQLENEVVPPYISCAMCGEEGCCNDEWQDGVERICIHCGEMGIIDCFSHKSGHTYWELSALYDDKISTQE